MIDETTEFKNLMILSLKVRFNFVPNGVGRLAESETRYDISVFQTPEKRVSHKIFITSLAKNP